MKFTLEGENYMTNLNYCDFFDFKIYSDRTEDFRTDFETLSTSQSDVLKIV